MPSPFDHLPEYQQLPEEAKNKVLEKFKTLPEGDQQTIMGKINTPMATRDVDPGLQDVPTIFNKSDFEADKIEKLSEDLAMRGVPPSIAALTAKTFQALPDIVATVATLGGGKAALKAGKVGLEAVGETSVGKAIRYTGEKEVARLTEKAAALPLKQTAKTELAQEVKKTAGEEIGKAEKLLNIAQKDTSASLRRAAIKTPEAIIKFADRASKLAEKGADKLAKIGSPETLQFYRKTADDALSKAGPTLAKEAKNKLYQIKKTFAEAIGRTTEGRKVGFDKALQKYDEISSVIKELPKESLKEKRLLTLALQKAKNEAIKQARTRKVVAGGAITAGVLAGGKKLVNKLTGD